MRLSLVSALAAAMLAAPAAAAPDQPGRYEMSRVDDGILRLDTATGAVSVCRREAEAWSCKPVSDPQRDLQREVDRLHQENDALRAALEKSAEKAVPPPPEVTDKKQDRLAPQAGPEMPGEETIDQMMAVLEDMMRRFRDMVESYQDHKHSPESPEEERRL